MTAREPAEMKNLTRSGDPPLEWGRADTALAARYCEAGRWQLYRFRFETVFGVATAEQSGATRWRFA